MKSINRLPYSRMPQLARRAALALGLVATAALPVAGNLASAQTAGVPVTYTGAGPL